MYIYDCINVVLIANMYTAFALSVFFILLIIVCQSCGVHECKDFMLIAGHS